MRQFFSLILLSAALTGCSQYETAGEKAVRSQKPLSESTGPILGDLNQRQQNDVNGMEETGGLNKYEQEQMDAEIGSTNAK